MNEQFRKLILTRLDQRSLNVNQLAVRGNVPRDVVYRFLQKKTKSIGSEVLGKIFTFLDIKVSL